MSDAQTSEDVKLWEPPADGSTGQQLTSFVNIIHRLHPTLSKTLPQGDYNSLYRWSVENISEFWAALWEFTQPLHSQPYTKVCATFKTIHFILIAQVIDETVPMDQVPVWFEGSRLNFAENLLRYRDDELAIVATGTAVWVCISIYIILLFIGEYMVGQEVRLTYGQLFERVRRTAGSLQQLGVRVGDRVVGYLPNCIESVVFMLASTALGAVWSCTSPDFGTTGVLDRFEQVKPVILISVNAVVYNGKVFIIISIYLQ
jgi:acetoacetyl-CoA synthetase